jgi:hypothetical protein
MTFENRNDLLRGAFTLSSVANAFGGAILLILVATGATAYPGHRFPIVAIAVGAVLLIQGVYAAAYTQEFWRIPPEVAAGALLGGELVSLCAAAATLVYAIVYNQRASNGGVEPGPFLAGAMMGANALLALILLFKSGALTPRTRERAGT